MAIIRWQPWSLSSLMDDDWELPTIPGLSRLGQGLNIYETEDSIVAQAALPGVAEGKIDVSIDNSVVRITGTREEKQEQTQGRKYYMTSMASAYNYSFKLPDGVVADQEPKASLEDGVLTLSFSKVQKQPPKKIKVVKAAKPDKR